MGQSCPNQVWAITFDWGALATWNKHFWTAFWRLFSGIPHLPIFFVPPAIWPPGHLMCKNYRRVGYPWKELSTCSSAALKLPLWDTPVKSYGQKPFVKSGPSSSTRNDIFSHHVGHRISTLCEVSGPLIKWKSESITDWCTTIILRCTTVIRNWHGYVLETLACLKMGKSWYFVFVISL